MNPIVNTLWLDSWRDARASLNNIIDDDVDDMVWDDLRQYVEDIIVEQSRDNVWYEVKYSDPAP